MNARDGRPDAGGADQARGSAFIAAAALVCLQWMVPRLIGWHPPQPWAALLPGLCILGSAFLMTWAAEAAEKDLPQNIVIGLLALITVLPEYAVDIYFAWTAGKDPSYTAYATANMTGGNRLLIGIGWPAVMLACWWKRDAREIRLSESNALELVILLAATAYSFIIPIKGTLSLVDAFALLSLFACYAALSAQAGVEEPVIEGPALVVAGLPAFFRRLAVAGLFLFSALAIYLAAGPFAEGILDAGGRFGIEKFLLVQWLAPLASEAPEFAVAVIFALKGKPGVAMRALVSSKVNQWTLLVATLPVAYALSGHSLAPMALDARQMEEIFLTSAQSLLGMVMLLNLSFSMREAVLLLGLFCAQVFFPQAAVRYGFAVLYLTLAGVLLSQARRRSLICNLIKSIALPRAR